MKTSAGVLLMPIPVSPNSDYMAGEDGNIYSRSKYKGFGRKETVDWYALAGHVTPKGYSTVSLSHNNLKVTKSVHRMVCMAFHGMPARPSLQVRHLDGDPKNNRPMNLAWGTQEENWEDRKVHEKPISNPTYKLSHEERQHLRWALQKGLCSQRMAARTLGLSQSSVWQLVNGK